MRFSHWIIRDAHTHVLTLGIFNTKYFPLKQWCYPNSPPYEVIGTWYVCLVQFHFADLNGTDLKCVKNVMTFTNLYPWRRVNMVRLYSSCQWTAASTFRYGAETENPKFWII